MILLTRQIWISLFLILTIPLLSQDKQAEKILNTADSLLESGNYTKAEEKFREYLSLPAGVKEDDINIEASCNENVGLCLYKQERFSDAIESFQATLDLYKEIGDLESVANTLNNIGLNYKMIGNYDKAIEYYEQTVSIDEELGKGNEIAKTLNNIGMVYRTWGKYDKAIEYFERSLSLRNNLGDKPGVSKSLNNMGLVYTDWKKYDQAILNFRESLKIENNLGNEFEAAIRYNNLGRVYFYTNQYDTALSYFEKNLALQVSNNDQGQIAVGYNNIGKVYLAEKNYAKALQYLSSALEIYTTLGKEGERSTFLANMSEIYKAMGNYDKAVQWLDSSTAIAERLSMRNQLLQNFLSYSSIFENLKNYRKSLDYYKKYNEEKDSVFSKEVLKQLSDFQIRYETEKKENEIKLLKQKEITQALELRKQTIIRNLMIAVSLLIWALAVVIYFSLQRKKKDNLIITEAREQSEKLLLNILPESIAHDLKERGKTDPKVFSDVTACFVDIVNFTQKSTMLEPSVLIDELNTIFTAFDNIIQKHACERIKTIGDSYMAVSGLPVPDPRHAIRIVDCCIDMIKYLQKRNTDSQLSWEIRIGINSGEVIAGVVGIKKYIYDVFGDTINTASRMESHSAPMRINVSASTYELVKDTFRTEFRGEIEVRGKGKLPMYYITE